MSKYQSRGKQRYNRNYPTGNRGLPPYESNRDRFDRVLGGDIEMDADNRRNQQQRHTPYMPRGGRRSDAFRGKHNRRLDPANTWYSVLVRGAEKMSKDFVLSTLRGWTDIPFVPINYRAEVRSATFYLTDENIANEIRNCSGKSASDGTKLSIFVNGCKPVASPMNAENIDRLKVFMSENYDVVTRTLRLVGLQNNQVLKREGLYFPLTHNKVLCSMVAIIKDNIPEIQHLDISNNNMSYIDPLEGLVDICNDLTVLNLANNRLKLFHLAKVKALNLVNLNLENNPVARDARNKEQYVSSVRTMFPKLQILDKKELPAIIGFDLGETKALPPTKAGFLPAEDIKKKIFDFLTIYYGIFDTGNRSLLLDAYHESALFSLSTCNILRNANMQTYIQESRNLLFSEPHRRKKLRQGKLNIVAALSDLPKVEHEPSFFIVDIFHVSATLMTFTVSGVFREVSQKAEQGDIRSVKRTLAVVPNNDSLLIVNEMMLVCNPSPQQLKAYHELKKKQPAVPLMPAPVQVQVPVPVAVPVAAMSIEQDQLQLIQSLCMATGMNQNYSKECLENNQWDYTKALEVFLQCKAQGVIPPEAYI